jgi:hypothetical protein
MITNGWVVCCGFFAAFSSVVFHHRRYTTVPADTRTTVLEDDSFIDSILLLSADCHGRISTYRNVLLADSLPPRITYGGRTVASWIWIVLLVGLGRQREDQKLRCRLIGITVHWREISWNIAQRSQLHYQTELPSPFREVTSEMW